VHGLRGRWCRRRRRRRCRNYRRRRQWRHGCENQ
jgi:hypothetical protein